MPQYSVYTQSKWDELHPSIEPIEEVTEEVTTTSSTNEEKTPEGTTVE